MTGSSNVAIGSSTLYINTTGYNNQAIGSSALYMNTTGYHNVAIGYGPLFRNTEGYYNVALGSYSLYDNTTGDYNIGIGYSALYNNETVSYNIGIGYDALGDNTTGERNIAIGKSALDRPDLEDDNLAIGYDALGGTINGGEYNVAIGNYSMDALTSGDGNTGIGYNAMTALTTGGGNVSLGRASGTTITSGSNNTVIGKGSDVSANSASNQTVIGYGATGHGNNIAVIGNTSTDAWHPADNNGVDLGSSSYEFADLYVDGVANVDAVRTGLIEYNDGDDAITIADGGDMDFNGNAIEDFTASIPSEITGATTLAASHNGQVLICNSGSDFSLTIPEDTLPKGFNCLIVQKGAGEITLAAASGNVTINNRNSHTKTANQWAIMTLICIDATTDANVFVSSGDGTS
jgi:hypothetical protein